MSSDPRFARLKTDPRFRKPKQKNLKVEIDERFRDVLESEEFGGSGKTKGKGKASAARVDKRGRPVATSHHADQLKRFYRLKSPSPTASGSGEKDFIDYARGEGVLESSGSEDEASEEESEVEDEELVLGAKSKRLPQYDVDDSEESDSEGSHLDIDLSEDEHVSAFPDVDDEQEESEEEDVESVPPTKRIAAVNLDWDNLRAADLYTIFNSFLNQPIASSSKSGESSAKKGKLLNVKIYPSEFGKGRLEKEEKEGPGGGIFLTKAGERKKNKRREEIVLEESEESEEEEAEEEVEEESGDDEGDLDEDDNDDELDGAEDDEEEAKHYGGEDLGILSDVGSQAGEDDIDMDQLRQYQLERLRYYYAIATFSSIEAAQHVMDECNGTEFERTANVLDLSYVPEDMEFAEDDLTDEADKEPKSYKGNDFVTDALRHSKVKLTWDQDDPNRAKLTRRTLTRDEIEDQDFKAFLASSDSEGEEEDEVEGDKQSNIDAKKDRKSKKAATKARTDKLRALLLSGGDEEEGDVWGKAGTSFQDDLDAADGKKSNKGTKDGEMEITFRPGLSVAKASGNGGGEDEENLTSLEKYQRRMKERKERKKEKLELKWAAKEGKTDKVDVDKDDFFGGESESDTDKPITSKPVATVTAKPSAPATTRSKAPPLSKAPEDPLFDDESKHFSMKDIIKSEKSEGKKRKRSRGKAKKDAENEAMGRTREIELGDKNFKIDVRDERFKAIHEEPEFAIDPSNPHFVKTKAMQDLLAERAKARAEKGSENGVQEARKPAAGVDKEFAPSGEKDLSALVKSVKRKMDGNSRVKKRSRK